MLAVTGAVAGAHPQLGHWDDTEWVLLAWVRVCLWQEQTAFGPAEPEPSMVSLRQAQGFRGGAVGKVGEVLAAPHFSPLQQRYLFSWLL